MKKSILIVCVVVVAGLGSAASADVFNMGPGLTSLETVPVGNPGTATGGPFDVAAKSRQSNVAGRNTGIYRAGPWRKLPGRVSRKTNTCPSGGPWRLAEVLMRHGAGYEAGFLHCDVSEQCRS